MTKMSKHHVEELDNPKLRYVTRINIDEQMMAQLVNNHPAFYIL
jgi:hypothetical protein